MKAAVLRSPFQINVEEVPKPSVSAQNVLVGIHSTAICGTDVGIYTGKHPVKFPLIMGHETTGEVVEVGKEVTKIHIGDRVVVDPTISCGTCYLCRMGKFHLCQEGGLMGREDQGSYAEFAVVPETRTFLLPGNISYEDGTTLIALANVLCAQRKLPYLAGCSLAILGMGVTGLLHLQLAKASGASPILVSEMVPWKLDLARRFKADVVVDAKGKDPLKILRETTSGKGADVVIESIGGGATIKQSFEMVRPGGIILQFGIAGKPVDGLDFYQIYYKELTILGTRVFAPRDMELSLKLASAGAVDLSPFITHRFKLAEIGKALEFIHKDPNSALRAVVQTV
jgi:2-desacetyl-2-hydroxyethyl bacteriochlorophyllide A dehydrogenase